MVKHKSRDYKISTIEYYLNNKNNDKEIRTHQYTFTKL